MSSSSSSIPTSVLLEEPNDENSNSGTIIKFVPFTSTITSSFWVRYCQEKLDNIQLSERPMNNIIGTYELRMNDKNINKTTNKTTTTTDIGICRFQLQETSLNHALDHQSTSSSCSTTEQQHNNNNNSSSSSSLPTPNDDGFNFTIRVRGTLLGVNTLEGFQQLDKNELLRRYVLQQQQQYYMDETFILSFLLLTYVDLKSHRVLYWFAVPTAVPIDTPIRAIVGSSTTSLRLSELWSTAENQSFQNAIMIFRRSQHSSDHNCCSPYFIYHNNKQQCLPLSSYSNEMTDNNNHLTDIIFGFFDPCCSSSSDDDDDDDKNNIPYMGWPMRNLVAYLSIHCHLGGRTVSILSCRPKKVLRQRRDASLSSSSPDDETTTTTTVDVINYSILLQVIVPLQYSNNDDDDDNGRRLKVVGWELNIRGRPGPRWVNLRPLLDPQHLAIQAADLNLKLMKWRMIPSLDVAMLRRTRVLVIGAGTLGCTVARTLLGWGIRRLQFVDNGKVSYSNPVRQSLFTLDDCHRHDGGQPKATAAAQALRHIAADVDSSGHVLSIPMPGHFPPTATDAEGVTSMETTAVTQLDSMVQESDVVFLLTDTRESRWLPTVMAAAYDKMLINAALGLDSWLVMRHGGGNDDGRLGCYFCNDVVAPENSMKNRTLDQQCTVTRPGLSPIASAMAAELMVALLHHPMKHRAPAPTTQRTEFSPTTADSASDAGALGVMPHQVRGSLVSYTMMTPTVPAFPYCTGCSPAVIEAYLSDKMALVQAVCESQDGSYLEELSGLTAFRAEAAEKMVDMEEWEDDE